MRDNQGGQDQFSQVSGQISQQNNLRTIGSKNERCIMNTKVHQWILRYCAFCQVGTHP